MCLVPLVDVHIKMAKVSNNEFTVRLNALFHTVFCHLNLYDVIGRSSKAKAPPTYCSTRLLMKGSRISKLIEKKSYKIGYKLKIKAQMIFGLLCLTLLLFFISVFNVLMSLIFK